MSFHAGIKTGTLQIIPAVCTYRRSRHASGEIQFPKQIFPATGVSIVEIVRTVLRPRGQLP